MAKRKPTIPKELKHTGSEDTHVSHVAVYMADGTVREFKDFFLIGFSNPEIIGELSDKDIASVKVNAFIMDTGEPTEILRLMELFGRFVNDTIWQMDDETRERVLAAITEMNARNMREEMLRDIPVVEKTNLS